MATEIFPNNNYFYRIGTMTANATTDINVPNSSGGVLICIGAYPQSLRMFLYNTNASGDCTLEEVSNNSASTQFIFTASTNKISAQNTQPINPTLYCIALRGGVPSI